VAVTSTDTVQEPLAGIFAPVVCPKLRVVAPAIGAHVGAPVQVVLAFGVAATCKPDGSVSVNLAPVNWVVFGFVMVNVNVEVPPTTIGFVRKVFVMVGFWAVPQPVKVTSSIYKSEPGLLFLAYAP